MILLTFVVVYGFWYDHKEHIHFNHEWTTSFMKAGIPNAIIDDITHDDDTWYYLGKSLCVAYGGDWEAPCPRHENYCGGGKKIGNRDDQTLSVYEALKNGGVHPKCPIIYPGAN